MAQQADQGRSRQTITAWAFLAPALILLSLSVLVPALMALVMTFTQTGLDVSEPLRLVITPIRKNPARIVPKKADYGANIRSELLWTTVLGVIPSFAIPWLRGMGDYVYSGWVNLLFGGLCVGFVTGAFWRPKRPVIMFNDGELQ